MPATFRGPLRVLPTNPRYFTDDRGRAILLAGSHTWAVMQDMWLEGDEPHRTDYAGFLGMCADNGHNCLRFWQWLHTRNAAWDPTPTLFSPQPWQRVGPGLARDGQPKFDLTRWNDDYFTRLRERVEAAGAHGLYVSVMMFEGWCFKSAGPNSDPWPYHPLHPDNNVNDVNDDPYLAPHQPWNYYSLACPQLLVWQKAYVRKVIETLNDLDHVLWEVCNEVPDRLEAMAWQDHLAAYIREFEAGLPKQHPVGITAEGGNQDNAELFATCADWISPSNGRCCEYRYNPPPADGRKVILSDTDHLWGHGGEVAWAWKSFCRGHNLWFMDPWEPIPGQPERWQDGDVSRNQRYYHAWDPLRRNLGYVRRVAERLDLASCVPQPERCTSGYCLANEGRELVCFLPTGGPEGLDLHDWPRAYKLTWLNPATGTSLSGGELRAGRHVLQAPFAGAAVAVVQAE